MSIREKSKPAPPELLDTNSRGVWMGWCSMGDKEVAREAATKGTHISLAERFLAARTGLSIVEAKTLFHDEVRSWILHLLTRNQVFKATHILKNMSLEPIEEMRSIFCDTGCRELRDNVGNHLLKLEKLDDVVVEAWCLLKNIEKNYDILHPLQENHISINVKFVMEQSREWQMEMGTDLFFRTFDFTLEPFVNSELAWRRLLRTDTNLLKLWITAYFGRTISIEICDVNVDLQTIDRLNALFVNLPITQEMIDEASSSNPVLDELSRFGVFDNAESNDLILLVRRLLRTNNLENFEQVLGNNNLLRFYEVLIKHCDQNGYHGLLSLFALPDDVIQRFADSSQWLTILMDVRKFENADFNNQAVLRRNIYDVARLLSSDDRGGDLGQYFSSFPQVLLSLVLFTEDIDVYDFLLLLLSNEVAIIKLNEFEINAVVFRKAIEDLPALKRFCQQKDPLACNSTMYDLLEKFSDLKVREVFSFRFEDDASILHFNQPELTRKYGCQKRVNFLYYIKQARPSYACCKLVETPDLVEAKTFKTALRNFLFPDVTSSCVAFLEMAGFNSNVLRIYINAANIIYHAGLLNAAEISDAFANVEINSEQICNLLESSVVQNINLSSKSAGEDLIAALKKCSLVIKFAELHHLNPPEMFLKYCAENNLWLPFLIYVQIHAYPVGLCCKLVQNFNDPNLVEHLSHCFSVEIPPDEPKSQLMGERDSRKYFLSRIGVRKSLDGTSTSEVSLTSHSSYGSMSSSCSSDFLESDTLDYKTDLLHILIRCHNSTDPPKALLHAARYYKSPFLAVLATSYEPDSLVTNWATWLAVSCDIDESCWSYDGVTLTSDSALRLLKCVLEKSFLKTLQNSFEIFLPDNPLKLVVEFLRACPHFNSDDDDGLIEKLQQFKKQLKLARSNSFVVDAAATNDMSYFTNKLWIQHTSMYLIAMMLQHGFASRHEQLRFLAAINDLRISEYFFIETPDFQGVMNILRCLLDVNCDINLDLSVIYDRTKFADEVASLISKLVAGKSYAVALQIAKVMNFPADEIICQEIRDGFPGRNREDFWTKCNEALRKADVAPSTVVKIYLECAEGVDFNLEKYEVLKLAYDWARRGRIPDLGEVEKSMWLAYFYLDDCFKKMEPIGAERCGLLYADLSKDLEEVRASNVALSEVEVGHWEKTVENLLACGDLATALRLEKIFGCKSIDLEILKLCLRLAEGILLPHQLSTEERLLLTKRANVRNLSTRRRTYVSRISSISSITQSPNTSSFYFQITDNVVAPVHDTIALLETLLENLKNGVQIALEILMTYRISVNIQTTYQEVRKCEKPIEMVRDALLNECDNKLQVVSDFVFVYNLSKEEVANFICDEIIKAATEYSKSKIDICFLWDMNADVDFNLVLQLFPDNCTILGMKLYTHASSLYKLQLESDAGFNLNLLVLVIELLIRAHDCFTADCNMEGISVVLKKCQIVISQLITLQNWKLIVRLLTGIARYSEMNYVFQILRVNGQFELLLRKGSRKDVGLKVALLEYLKKYCPDDLELYKIVALHFFLFSEIALLWEQEAEVIVRRMITLAKLDMQNDKMNLDTELFVLFRNNEDTKRLLHKIMSNYKHASEYHLYGEKLSQAMNAAKQAELLALQLSLLKDLPNNNNATCICLLNLSTTQILTLITTKLSFPQAAIMVEAYNYQVDWALVLYERYLVGDDAAYLSNFLSAFALTEALVHDVSRKFLSAKNLTPTLVRNMKSVLNKLPSVHTKYRIASELGFSDIVRDLLDGHQLAYLKDTVWKKGYKSCKD